MQPKLEGLVAAPYTPLRPDGELAIDVIPRLAASLAHNHVRGAFVCGTTGEGFGLTSAERISVVNAWAAARPATLSLIVHVGHLSLSDSRALARHAQEVGADAIATIAPSFFKPAGAGELVAWCAKVASAAPDLPFYYYHMPAMTGVNITVTDFLSHANGQIPSLAGIKFTHEDLLDFGCASDRAGGRLAMLFGRDEILLSGLSLGAAGAVGSTYNFAAPLFVRLMDAFNRGDLASARVEQSRAREFITILHRHGGLAAGKAIMRMIGLDCGPVRLPLRSLTRDQEDQLRRELEEVNFFSYCSQLP